MAKTSAHFKPVKPGSEEHNRRLKKLDYVRDELTKNNRSWSAQSVADRLEQIKQLNALAQSRGQSLAAMAIAWVLRQDAVTSALVGASRPAQILDVLDGLNVNSAFADDELARIDAILK